MFGEAQKLTELVAGASEGRTLEASVRLRRTSSGRLSRPLLVQQAIGASDHNE